ncbi:MULTISPECIES: hypothetical protein [unclassified Nonomuraea]
MGRHGGGGKKNTYEDFEPPGDERYDGEGKGGGSREKPRPSGGSADD